MGHHMHARILNLKTGNYVVYGIERVETGKTLHIAGEHASLSKSKSPLTCIHTRAYRTQGHIDSTRRGHATSIVTVGKILIVAKIVSRAKWKPCNATLVLVGVLGECC